jgi:hypothetical protein
MIMSMSREEIKRERERERQRNRKQLFHQATDVNERTKKQKACQSALRQAAA